MRELDRFVKRRQRDRFVKPNQEPPILPVLLSDVDELPEIVKRLFYFDLRDYSMLAQSKVGHTRRSRGYREAIFLIAKTLYERIKH